MELKREIIVDGVLFSTDKSMLDIAYIHQFISSESYWAKGVPRWVLERSIQNSLCIGIYENKRQIGFARLVTDYATFGYLADVFVDGQHRKKGISKNLMKFILSFEDVKLFRRLILATLDAHGLYAQFGFKPLKSPDRFMEIHNPDIYKRLDEIHS
jgi:N-acetylglutamate synthase-like GNAT family acetyltransferase